MIKIFKTLMVVVVALMFAGDERNGVALRSLGNVTGFEACYTAADMADSVQKSVGWIFQDVEGYATEEINGWKEFARGYTRA